MKPISEILAAIGDSIAEGDKAFNNFFSACDPRAADYRDEQHGLVDYFLDRAFWELKLFLEAKGMPQMLQAVTADHLLATKDFMKSEMAPWGEPYSFWAGRLRQL